MKASNGLAVNPFVRIQIVGDSGEYYTYLVIAPRKGRELGHTIVHPAQTVRYDVARRFYADRDQLLDTLNEDQVTELKFLGILINDGEVPSCPAFRPTLDDSPNHRLPPNAYSRRYHANGEFCFEPPSHNETSDLFPLFSDYDRAIWHRLSEKSPFVPWWPTAKVRTAVEELAASGYIDVGAQYSLRTIQALSEARFLMRDERELLQDLRGKLFRDKFCNLSLFPAALTRALASYYQEAVAQGFCSFGDPQASRFSAFNDRIGRLAQAYAIDVVSAIAVCELKPSYSFFSGYRDRALLKPHTDREQCQLTLTLMLRYEPTSNAEAAWPLVVQDDRVVHEVRQRVGDSILFRGIELTHSRPMLPEGHECDVLLMHYVDEQFSGTLD